MKKNEIEVTNEQLHKRGEECGTFSDEYWRSMTIAQQEELVRIRKSKVSDAAYRVFENEEAAGIQDKVEVLRSRKGGNDEAIRDLYFSIPDEETRITAINDLYCYECARNNHDTSTVLEAYYRFSEVQRKLIFGWLEWPKFKKLVLIVTALNAGVFAARLIFDITTYADWFLGVSVLWVFACGVYLNLDLRRQESHYFLLWEVEKLRRGVQDREVDPPMRRYELFGERERQSGKRSVPREIPW